MNDSEVNYLLLGLCVGTLFVLACFSGDSGRVIDVRAFGEQLCESKGMSLSEIKYMDYNALHKIVAHNPVPIIHCKQNNTKSIYDGTVVEDK